MTTLVPAPIRPLFQVLRNDPCPCASGERFRRCCGSVSPNRPIPHGIHITRNYLDTDTCERLLAHAAQQTTSPLRQLDREKSTAEHIVRSTQIGRVTLRVDMQQYQEELNTLLARIVTDNIEPLFSDKASWFESPQLMRYEPGCYYWPHADSENLLEAENHWVKDLDRDASILLYLDSTFEGGQLYFPYFDFKLSPEPGMLVTFPSDSRYLHEALEVTSGVRHAIVSWVALAEQPKLRKPPEEAVFC
jgi:predicted 2-oxoglutarate/Fe(II)-dependent dioxygenase YbiX